MTRQFTKREWLQIKAPPTNQEQLKLFYRFWVSDEQLKIVSSKLVVYMYISNNFECLFLLKLPSLVYIHVRKVTHSIIILFIFSA